MSRSLGRLLTTPFPLQSSPMISERVSVVSYVMRAADVLTWTLSLWSHILSVYACRYAQGHIWACPPSEGDDYIFHCHPPDQKIPKPKRLQEWYRKMLDKAFAERILHDYKVRGRHGACLKTWTFICSLELSVVFSNFENVNKLKTIVPVPCRILWIVVLNIYFVCNNR